MFGIIIRNRAHNIPLTDRQLYDYIKKGKSVLLDKVTEINNKLDVIMNKKTRECEDVSLRKNKDRIDKIIKK